MWLLTLIAGGFTLYYGAVLGGIYKDPLMSRFRQYGEERRPYPVCRFLEVACVFCFLLGLMVRIVTSQSVVFQDSLAPLSLWVLAGMLLASSLFIRRRPVLRESLPRWYYELVKVATRQERRFLGFAWLRIPRKMRWRLNGDQAAFKVWADMVRITVIYGARDPDDPWALWN